MISQDDAILLRTCLQKYFPLNMSLSAVQVFAWFGNRRADKAACQGSRENALSNNVLVKYHKLVSTTWSIQCGWAATIEKRWQLLKGDEKDVVSACLICNREPCEESFDFTSHLTVRAEQNDFAFLEPVGTIKTFHCPEFEDTVIQSQIDQWRFGLPYIKMLCQYFRNLEYSETPCTYLELFLDITAFSGLIPDNLKARRDAKNTIHDKVSLLARILSVFFRLISFVPAPSPDQRRQRTCYLTKYGCPKMLPTIRLRPRLKAKQSVIDFLALTQENPSYSDLKFSYPFDLKPTHDEWHSEGFSLWNRARAEHGLPYSTHCEQLEMKWRNGLQLYNSSSNGGHMLTMVAPLNPSKLDIEKHWKRICMLQCLYCNASAPLSGLASLKTSPCNSRNLHARLSDADSPG